MKLHIKYLEKAEKEIIIDLENVKNDMDIYLPTKDKLGREPNIDDHIKAKKLLDSGFNISKAIDDQVKLEFALRDMHFILMRERGEFNNQL